MSQDNWNACLPVFAFHFFETCNIPNITLALSPSSDFRFEFSRELSGLDEEPEVFVGQ